MSTLVRITNALLMSVFLFETWVFRRSRSELIVQSDESGLERITYQPSGIMNIQTVR
jgi:hypothetical protein